MPAFPPLQHVALTVADVSVPDPAPAEPCCEHSCSTTLCSSSATHCSACIRTRGTAAGDRFDEHVLVSTT